METGEATAAADGAVNAPAVVAALLSLQDVSLSDGGTSAWRSPCVRSPLDGPPQAASTGVSNAVSSPAAALLDSLGHAPSPPLQPSSSHTGHGDGRAGGSPPPLHLGSAIAPPPPPSLLLPGAPTVALPSPLFSPQLSPASRVSGLDLEDHPCAPRVLLGGVHGSSLEVHGEVFSLPPEVCGGVQGSSLELYGGALGSPPAAAATTAAAPLPLPPPMVSPGVDGGGSAKERHHSSGGEVTMSGDSKTMTGPTVGSRSVEVAPTSGALVSRPSAMIPAGDVHTPIAVGVPVVTDSFGMWVAPLAEVMYMLHKNEGIGRMHLMPWAPSMPRGGGHGVLAEMLIQPDKSSESAMKMAAVPPSVAVVVGGADTKLKDPG